MLSVIKSLSVIPQRLLLATTSSSLTTVRLQSYPQQQSHLIDQQRCVASFFNRYTGKQLWKSATTVSMYGKKKGQRPRIRFRNLNFGRRIGQGPMRVAIPGLNQPLLTQMEDKAGSLPRSVVRSPKILPQFPDYQENFDKMRDTIDLSQNRNLSERLDPLERGYSGTKFPGRRIGLPTQVDQNGNVETIPGFESICLELKRVICMKGREGRRQRMSCLVVVGNGQGMAGWATVKREMAKPALKAARDMAVKRLCHFELLDKRTIHQNFYAQYNRTFLYAYRMPPGYGVVAHRVLKSICQVIGIKDIYIKLEGAVGNEQAITRAFFAGLNHQETYQQLAERKRLLVVRQNPNEQYMPRVVAEPITAPVRSDDQIEAHEELDIDEIYGQGRNRKAKPSLHERNRTFWERYAHRPEVERKLWQIHPQRNFDKVRLQLLADNVVPRWTRDFRHQAAKQYNEQVVNCERPFPIGLGLSDVMNMQESAEPEED